MSHLQLPWPGAGTETRRNKTFLPRHSGHPVSLCQERKERERGRERKERKKMKEGKEEKKKKEDESSVGRKRDVQGGFSGYSQP